MTTYTDGWQEEFALDMSEKHNEPALEVIARLSSDIEVILSGDEYDFIRFTIAFEKTDGEKATYRLCWNEEDDWDDPDLLVSILIGYIYSLERGAN